MKFGYMRISTFEGKQCFDRQLAALTEAGVDERNIYKDEISGSKEHRPGLDNLLSVLKEGDTLVILEFSRLSRSMKQLLSLVDDFNEKGIDLISLHENIDTTTPEGKLFFRISACFAEYERELTCERVREGLEQAKEKGVKLGHPKANSEAIDTAITLYQNTSLTSNEICERTGISRATLYRYLKARGIQRR